MSLLLKIIVLILCLYNLFCDELAPNFCDDNYIDAILLNETHYILTRDKWIAVYDETTKTVGKLTKNTNLSGFTSN